MVKILSWNVNGLRSAYKKRFLKWLKSSKADIICLQEIRSAEEQIPEELKNVRGYYSYFNPSKTKKGYSGTAVYTKIKPLSVNTRSGLRRFDDEGRFLELKFKDFTLIDLYIVYGGRQKENMGYKIGVYRHLLSYLKKRKNEKIILMGDFNIAHTESDLAQPKNNKNNTMFTPNERKQIDRLISLGFIDTFRKFNQKGGNYTWWVAYANARKRNLGWRIDYAFASKSLAKKIKNASIYPKVMGSDHCPIGIGLE